MTLVFAGIQTSRLSDRDGLLRDVRASSVDADTMTGSSHVMRVDTSGALDGSTMELVDVHGAGLLVTKDLPESPDGFRWRLWGVDAQRTLHPLGDLDPTSEGNMGLQPVAELHAKPYDALAITLEPQDSVTSNRGPVVGWAQMT